MTAPILRRWPTSARATVVLLAAALLFVGWSVAGRGGSEKQGIVATTSTTPTTSTTFSRSTTTSFAVGEPAGPLLDRLVVAAPSAGVPDYRRIDFGDGWNYDPATGCNTRERVLIEESLRPPGADDRCRSTTGRWRSAYDGLETDDPSDLQIDHVVPLANAWRSGAYGWTQQQRVAFANDLDRPESLIAVSSRSNESKSDGSPDEWLPPDRSDWCSYATSWIDIKVRWQLTITSAEHDALARVLRSC